MTMSRAETMTPTTTLKRTVSPARRFQNGFSAAMIALGTAIVLLPLFLIVYYLLLRGLPTLSLNFFLQPPGSLIGGGGGVAHAIVGSLIMLAIALAIGLLIGIATGIFLAEYAEHPLVPYVRVMSDVLTGIPAIVVGLVVYGLLVATIGRYTALAGGVALGLIMIPVIVRATEEVLKLVPMNLREAGLALGLPRWKVILSIVLPAARSGIITGVILAVARVSGEAAPLLFTALGNNFLSWDPTQPMSALPLVVYKYALSPFDYQINQAWAAALLLVLSILVASFIARAVAARRR